jgi:hypothetical protein
MTQQQIEEIELKYLTKYYHFLKYNLDDILRGFVSRDKIRSDWDGKYGNKTISKKIEKLDEKISDFCTGAERILYYFISGKAVGIPNSCPIASDLFFETDDAYVHIDIKTVGASLAGKTNIGDFVGSIFIGRNQNSYKGIIKTNKGDEREYLPVLPAFYNKGKDSEKICLSYFLSILYDTDTYETLVISLSCMPNGELESHYKTKPLSAGKIHSNARFNFSNTPYFELLKTSETRTKTIYFNDKMNEVYRKKLKYFESLI